MSVIETVNDVKNTFLSRREITCNFNGLAGKLKKLEAIDMISKEFKLDGKIIVPIRLKNHVGKPLVTGTFYVYEDENLAKSHVDPTVFKRLDKAKKSSEEKTDAAKAKPEKDVEAKPEKDSKDKPKEEDVKTPPKNEKKESKENKE